MQNSEIVSRGTKSRSAFMIKAMAGLMAVAMIAAGCGSDDEAAPAKQAVTTTAAPAATAAPATTAAPAATAAPAPGAPSWSGDVTIAVMSEPVSLAGWRAFGAISGSPGYRNVVEFLIGRDFRGDNSIVPELATSWERVDDRTIRFYLREGVTFHDGSPLNAEGAAQVINYVMSEELNSDLLDFVGAPMSAVAVDEYTIDVSTPDPDPILLSKMYFVAITSAKQLNEAIDTYDTNLIGTGPYQFVEWNAGQGINYTANPDWWGHGNPWAARGSVTVENLHYVFRAEEQVRASMVAAGEANIGVWLSSEQCADLGGCAVAPSVETIFIRPDTHGPMFSDIRVREAFHLAIDTEGIVDTILAGEATLAAQICNATCTGHDPALVPYPYDPDRSVELLAAAAADGVPVDMEINLAAREAVFPRSEEVIQAVQAMLTEVGFSVSTNFYDPETFGQMVVQNWKDVPEDRNLVIIHGHGNEIFDMATSYQYYYSCEGILSVYCNEEAEALWNEALPLEGDARNNKLVEMNRVLHGDWGNGYIGHQDLAYGVQGVDWEPSLAHSILAKQFGNIGN